MISYDVVIVGGGPSGLAAAYRLKKLGVASVLVLERSGEVGGVPQHCAHLGFGIRHLKKLLTGPQYAKVLKERALKAGVDIRVHETVTGLDLERKEISSVCPGGLRTYSAKAILLATGCRETTRNHLRVAGFRGKGIYNTSQIQQFIHLHHAKPGNVAVVFGSEDIGLSAVMTLSHAKMKVAGLVDDKTELQGHKTFTMLSTVPRRVPFFKQYALKQILGTDRVTAVEIVRVDENGKWIDGTEKKINCDTVVFSGRFVPENEVCKTSQVVMDSRTQGPIVDQTLHSEHPGVFAAGNLLRSVETGDVAAIEGEWAADGIKKYLDNPKVNYFRVKVEAGKNVRWVMPQRLVNQNEKPPKHIGSIRVKESKFWQKLKFKSGDKNWASRRHLWFRPEHRVQCDFGSWQNSAKESITVSVDDR